MMKRALIVLLSYLSITTLLNAQERIILRTNGEQIKISNSKVLREAITETKLTDLKGKKAQSIFPKLRNPEESIDTVGYRKTYSLFNTNFGFLGQDVMFMWFEAPADMDIKAIGFTCSDDEGAANATVSLRLIKLNWTKEQLMNFNLATPIGYYPSSGDGFSESDYFGEEATGVWVSKDSNNPLPPWTDNADPAANTFDYNLWYPTGFPWPLIPVASDVDNPIYNWLEVDYSTSVKRGDIYAVVVIHDGVTINEDRIGFWSDNTIGYPGWKYYANGRTSSEEPGWWVRMYTWDFAVVADITSCMPPIIRINNPLLTTLSTEPRPVCAEVEMDIDCLGGSDSVRVELIYIIDDSDTNIVKMSTSDNYNYCAEIPGQLPTTSIRYWVQVIDKEEFLFRSREIEYFIFQPTTRSLLVFNGFREPSGYPQSYYFGSGDFVTYSTLEWDHDSWAFGSLTEELVNNYSNIIEITTNGPKDINNDVIKAWLAEDGIRNYMLAGDEWLGAQTDWTNQAHEAGSFHYDILGITFEYNDISYTESGDQTLATEVNAIEGSLLGGALYDLHQQISDEGGWTSQILYDPTYEIGVDNWLDGVDFVDDVEVDMTGLGIDDNTYNIAGHRTLATGNKITFLAFDPLSLHSYNETYDDQYYWYGFTKEAPHQQALRWFDSVVGVKEEGTFPEKFSLSQNYPNPFNPSTTIKYSIPSNVKSEMSNIKLVVYDILGREIATLVNKEQKPGNYEVQFEPTNLTSGLYFYRLQLGSFIESRKMLLLK